MKFDISNSTYGSDYTHTLSSLLLNAQSLTIVYQKLRMCNGNSNSNAVHRVNARNHLHADVKSVLVLLPVLLKLKGTVVANTPATAIINWWCMGGGEGKSINIGKP